jgi:quercetin dioxygenase-like cupin family protein
MEGAMDHCLQLENRHTGEKLLLRRVREASGEIILTIDGTLPAGADGPPLHIHFQEREEGTVKAGTLGAQVGGEKIVVRAGGSAVFAAGVVHKWWNAGDDLLEFSGRAVPAVDLDRYLQAIFAVVNAGPPGRPSIFYLARVARRHWNTQALAVPPRAVQRILFPLIILLGRLLGKYRGDDWPGSPASCPGAPEAP